MLNEIKLTDYIADFLAKQGIKSVFVVSGGASLHLIHSIAAHSRINHVCTHHEQAAAMAADGYSRVSCNIGVAIATSGPGATNLITGIACSFYDSVPLLIITGQVSTFRMTGNLGVRQIGFQETPITSIVKSITKYSTQLQDPLNIRFELEKAISIATSARPGPVLIDIPDNLQRQFICPNNLKGYQDSSNSSIKTEFIGISDGFEKFKRYLSNSSRPILIGGWGLHLSNTEAEFVEFAEALQIPVALTWAASDVFPSTHKLYVGTFGTHGMRHANFAVQNSDLIISLGSRLDTKATGSPVSTFAREAKKIIVDIDPNELRKFKHFDLRIDLMIQEDLRHFFKYINSRLKPIEIKRPTIWLNKIDEWRDKMKLKIQKKENNQSLDPYFTFSLLNIYLPKKSLIFIDTGCAIAWSMQTLTFKFNQRIFHDFNNTAMGWSLPAAVGGYFANPKLPIVCIIGDGSLMMTIQELSTISHHQIPLKIILVNNSGYSMIKQTQDQWLSSDYVASSYSGGLSFPKFDLLAETYGLEYFEASAHDNLEEAFKLFFQSESSSLINLRICPNARVKPQVKYGKPNEDMEPLLSRDEFLKEMIIKPLND